MSRGPGNKAFTLIELLTVLAVISLLTAILLPALSKVKCAARALVSAANQRQITQAIGAYAGENNEWFPESVATLGTSARFSWREPMVLTGFQKRSPHHRRSVSDYLREYIPTAKTLSCASAPHAYKYLEDAWLAGDAWDNPSPDTGYEDPVFGTYCLYWNYRGYLMDRQAPFMGPDRSFGERGRSTLLISDYFGFGHWRNELTYGTRKAFGSCEKFSGAGITAGTPVSSDYWSRMALEEPADRRSVQIVLHAGYTDGHVAKYSAEQTRVLKVAITPDGSVPYPDNVGPAGDIYLPLD
ncbi:MAG: type II secretion system protein [Phycisphaerae bacterium]|nr:type II secretion system protein [Phycisphaerae bacterium]